MPIQINNLFHTYLKNTPNVVEALKGVTTKIESGSFVAFVGETGSGKSTLVQHLNGLLLPDEGTIEIDEYLITNQKKKFKKLHDLRKHVGLIFQFPEYQLFEETVIKDVSFGPKNFGLSEEEAKKAAEKALFSVGLNESYFERSPFELSGGEKRKVAIAGILAIDPDIIVLDEPTAGLDPNASRDIMSLINSLHDKGKTIILVTHHMALVGRFCQKVFFMKNGKIVFEGTPAELFALNDDTLEVPHLFMLIRELNKRGFSIPAEQINDIDDLFKFIKGIKNE